MASAAGSIMTGTLLRLAALRQRTTWVWVHRWCGLVMASFLILAGITGSLLAWLEPLSEAISPEIFQAASPYPGAAPLDPFTLRERAQAAVGPQAHVGYALLNLAPGRLAKFYVEAEEDERTGKHRDLGFDEIYIDPYTGAEILRTRWGNLNEGRHNLMPFIYRLHYSLALGEFGTTVFGIIALLWTLDCFVGAYLTFPKGRPFFTKWTPAWGIKTKRFNYDLHRASGLWTWALLFVFAWSSVALNLHDEIYRPVTEALMGMNQPERQPDEAAAAPVGAAMTWQEAYEVGRRLMEVELPRTGEIALYEDSLSYSDERGEFTYWVLVEKNDNPADPYVGVIFDAATGVLRRVDQPRAEQTGDVVTRWLYDLHMARIGGLPYRLLVCLMGLIVAALSVTGVLIWWRKRRSRRIQG